MKKKLKFKFPKSAPTDGTAFLAILPGPAIDICWYDETDKCFRDYFRKQKIAYMISWSKLPETDGLYEIFGCSYLINGEWIKDEK